MPLKYFCLLLFVYTLSACNPFSNQPANSVESPPQTQATDPTLSEPVPAANTPAPAIIIDNTRLQTYAHSSQQFTVSYPAGWQPAEQPNGVIFIDPTNQAGYSIFYSQSDTLATRNQLTQAGMDFITQNFAEGLVILSQDDAKIQFKNIDPALGPAINELWLTQHDDLVFFRLISVVEAQWGQTSRLLQNLTATLNVSQAQNMAPLPTATPEQPIWLIYGHTTERFTFVYPNNWQFEEGDSTAHAFWPETQFSFEVKAIPLSATEDKDGAAERYALTELETLSATYSQFDARNLEPYQAGQATGYTFDYLYANEAGIAMAASIIVTVIEDKLYHITISAPAISYEAALAWFNPMLQSFQLLPEDDTTQP